MRCKHHRRHQGRFTRLASRYRSLFAFALACLALLLILAATQSAQAQTGPAVTASSVAATVTADEAPVLLSAAVDGATLTLTYNELLDGGSIAAPEDFTVRLEGAKRSVSEVVVNGRAVELTLDLGTEQEETGITVSYTPWMSPIQDAAGNDASEFTEQAVTNRIEDRGGRASGALPLRAVRQIETLLAKKAQRTRAQRKMSSQLLPARRDQQYGVARLQAPVETAADEMVTVDIRADVTPAVLARIRALGGTVVNSVPKYRAIRARIPLAAVEPLAGLASVQTIRPADEAVTGARAQGLESNIRRDVLGTGGIHAIVDTSEGDVAHRANVARTTHMIDGIGIGIGVLSNGVATLAIRQASGDLPDRVTVLAGQAGRGDEGTAMLEIVHDLAPGAELYFATAFSGQAQFAANIEALCEAGADVIVDDVYYFTEAAFQDGVVAQGVNAAVADGCVFIPAGGNGGNRNDGTAGVWEGDYAAARTLVVNGVSVGVLHDFGSGEEENRITEDGRGFVLQWADPLGASANDYDLFLIDADDNVIDFSMNTQDGTQDPIEFISSSEDDHTDARLLIVKTAGAEDRYLRLDTLEGRLAVATEGNLFGHEAAENAISVAAVDARAAAGSGGVFNGTESVQRSNSDGPRRIFFQPDGTPITAGNFSSTGGKLLQKPDLAAATCVSTSTPGFSPFCGVSSAAPHAAAIAALMLEAAGGPGNVTLAALRTAMTGASLDIEATGVDRDSGAGIVMAPGAVDAVDVAKAGRNKVPTVDSTLADRTLAPGAAVTVDVASAFSDPDNNTLTYTALSSDPDRLEVSLTGSMLTLTPKSPGVVMVTVRAVDSHGLSVTLTVPVAVAVGTRDYDVDNDGLIEVGNLAQFDAVRYDLDGDGMVDIASDWQSYYAAAAFVDGALDMGCPSGCLGYELTENLNFDTNDSGGADAGDDYWNDGEGWVPIGGDASSAIGTSLFPRNPFTAIFEGNGHTVGNLYIDTDNVVLVGLFGYASSSIRNLGAIDVDVTGDDLAGGLIGFNSGEILASYVTGRVAGKANVGGLVGINQSNDEILASYATSHVSGEDDVGGLIGDNRGKITAGYATGRVSGEKKVGGLVGFNQSTGEILAGYATGLVSGDSDVGGLVGSNEGAVTLSYWDTNTSGHATGSSGEGKTTAQLQTSTGFSGIYRNWNLDLDGDQINDLHFGTASQYPVLSVDTNGVGGATWQEFGYQLREGPALTVTADPAQAELSWTAVETSHWNPAPAVTYTLYRNDGATLKTLGEGLSGLTFTDTDVTAGTTYTYQVAAVVTGGEATRSALASATALPNMWLSPTASDPVASVRSAATYSVTFQGTWTTTVTSGGVPSGAHFTTLIGGVHNTGMTFLREGGMASAGVELMAELGGTSTLANEVRAAQPNALSVLQGSGGNIGPTGSSTISIVALTTDHPRVTLLTMVAPSPDWFVGVSGLSLLDDQGDWLASRSVDLYPWDAGTEDGTEFSLSNPATSPQGIITSLRGMGQFSNEPIATLTFTRQSVNTAPSFTSTASFQADENQTAAATVAAADLDSTDGVSYAITGGTDSLKFNIGETTGVLTFKVPPNYESPADVAGTDPLNDAGNNEYIVTVTATGGTGGRALTTEQTITVTVRNLDEAGTVSFSQVGSAIRARLSDPDGGVNSRRWQWARSSDRSTGWTNIDGATSASYTPSSDDEEMYLRATVSYNDAQDSGKQAQGVSSSEIAPPDLQVETLVSNLSIPWGIAFAPDGTMLFTQRGGVLSSRLADGTVQTVTAEFGDLFARGETGLMGIVVDPGFASNRRFYTCQGHTGPEIQVIAWTINAAYTVATRVADPLIGGMPASSGRHGGCRLRFGPQGYLWIATGDAATGTVPQDLTSLGGKVLRVDASTGAGGPANSFAPSPVYTYGHRNVQGLALRPGTSQMWSVEHGPSVDDEINLLVAGRNYGWDPVPGYNEGVSMTDLVKFPDALEARWSSGSPTLATSGGIFLEGAQWGVWEGRLAVATLRDSKLRLFEFTPEGAFVSRVIVPELDGAFGRLRTPMLGPDGALYVSTSNGNGADRILRIAEDTTAPTVSMVAISSNPGPDLTYAIGETIEATVTFDETVVVTGLPRLSLTVGTQTKPATYDRGSNSDTLVFAYPVASGDLDTDGVSIEAGRLSLNGGTIKDGSDNDAELDHDGLAADAGHQVDGVRPVLAASDAAVVNEAMLTLSYNEPLDGNSTPASGDFTVDGGDHTRTITQVVVRGATVELTLDPGAEHEEAGIQVSYTPAMNPIRDAVGNAAGALSRVPVTNDTPDTTPPKVSSLAITSNPGADQIYAAEDEIEVTVTFSETVEVEGTPQLRLRVGTRTRTAGYDGGTGTAALVFAYEVADGDEDTDGVSIEAGRIALNGGTIEDEADNDAVLDHEAVAPQAGHKVDGVRPAFVSAAVDGSSLTLTYGKALDPGSRPASADFTVEVDGSGRSVSGVSVSDTVVTLTLNPAVEHGDTGIRVSYSPGTNPIRDAVGNDAVALSNRSVTNTTGAPNTVPEITSPSSFDVPENQALARRLAARDTDPGDEVTGWEIVGGADQGQFTITSDTGDLSFLTAPDFEAPGDNEYEVRVEVKSGAGARELEAEQTFTLRVTDEREPPDIPEVPTFSGETQDSLTVSWAEPHNTGPAITDYDVQYREKGRGRFSDGQHEGPGLSLTLDDLDPGTAYEVQVRAANDEGISDWSEPGEGMTITPLTVQMTTDLPPPVEGAFTVRFSFSEEVMGFTLTDITTQQEPACTDSVNNPISCNPTIAALQTTDNRIFTTTMTPRADPVAHNYTLTLTVPGGRVTSIAGNKPNEEAMLEVRVAPPGVTLPVSAIDLSGSAGNAEVRLSWNRPTEDGGSAIIRYEYRFAAAGEDFSAWENVRAGTRRVTVGGLINGTEYVFEVRAVNALGKGGAETVSATPEIADSPSPPPGGGGFPPPPGPPSNNSPTADAGPDQTGVREGALVTLDGSGSSDPDDDPLRYRWNQSSGESVVLSSRDVANPTFTAPQGLTADAVLSFRLLVTDPGGRFDSDTVTVTVEQGTSPPVTEEQIYYFSHLAVGEGWQTTITYINYSSEEVSCRTDFLSDQGTPLLVSFAGRGTVPSRSDVLLPGGSVHQETNLELSAPLARGWARATCSGPLKASLLYRRHNSEGMPTAEAGVNATTVPATRFVTFAEQGEGQFGTGVAYANPSPTSATVTFTARDAAGQVLASVDQNLLPGGHDAQNMVDLFDLSSFSGSLEVTSTQPIVSLSLNNEADPVFSSLPPGELDADAQGPQQMTTYYFPHLAVGEGWQTTITYINYSPQEVSCQTEFLSDHGSPLLVSFAGRGMDISRSDVLPPGGSVHEETNVELSAPRVAGWARATCSGPVKASLLYRRFEGGVPTGEAGVNAVTIPARRFVTFAEQGEGRFGTGVAYANPSDTAALVTFTARDAAGQTLASIDRTLLPNGHDAKNMVDLFDLSSFTGSLEVTSTEPIVSLSLNVEADPVFSSLPPGEVDAAAQGTTRSSQTPLQATSTTPDR